MSESLNNLLTYSKQELDLIGMTDTELGKSMLNYLEQLHKATSGNYMHMRAMVDQLGRLTRREPLSPITREEMTDQTITPENYTVVGTKRYEFVIQDTDGEFYDTRGITFVNEAGQKYHTGKSKVKVTFPYYPTEKLVYDNVNC